MKNRIYSTLIGLLSLAPLVSLFLFPLIMNSMQIKTNEERLFLDRMFDIYFYCNMSLFILLLAGFTVFIYKSDVVPHAKRNLWVAVLFFGNYISIPVFWYLYIWRRSDN